MPLYLGGTHIGGASVSVITPKLQNKTITPTTSEQIITPDTGYDGLNQVTVAASGTGDGEDGSIETCTLTVSSWSDLTMLQAVILVDGNMVLYNSVIDGKLNTIEIVKNSIITGQVSSPKNSINVNSNARPMIEALPAFAFFVMGDMTITVS